MHNYFLVNCTGGNFTNRVVVVVVVTTTMTIMITMTTTMIQEKLYSIITAVLAAFSCQISTKPLSIF
jgi:hypothetical protein